MNEKKSFFVLKYFHQYISIYHIIISIFVIYKKIMFAAI